MPERKYPPIHYWGIASPSGWLQIVLDSSIRIEILLHEMLATGVAVDDLPGCVQIKEKFGELRISCHAFDNVPFPPSMREVLAQAGAQARRTCSVCGVPGMSRTGLGLSPFCDECSRAEYEKSQQGWAYDVEVVSGAKVFDVKVDADKGTVISAAEDKADRDDDHDK